MLLGVIPMFCFGIFRIFGGHCKNEENWKIWAKLGSYAKAWDTLAAARPRCQNGTPRVRRGIAKLRHSEGLR